MTHFILFHNKTQLPCNWCFSWFDYTKFVQHCDYIWKSYIPLQSNHPVWNKDSKTFFYTGWAEGTLSFLLAHTSQQHTQLTQRKTQAIQTSSFPSNFDNITNAGKLSFINKTVSVFFLWSGTAQLQNTLNLKVLFLTPTYHLSSSRKSSLFMIIISCSSNAWYWRPASTM